jgi:glycosyltransferase involved in cell wall biosynthesis
MAFQNKGEGMEESEIISIIIPVFNIKPYLSEALNSVLNQTYTNLEIIIIDDGSTDESGMVCDEFAKKDNRIIVVHQENKGLSEARNVGLDMMTGNIVAFLDPDDRYQSDYIMSMLSTMNQYNADIVICKNAAIRTTNAMSLKDIVSIEPQMAKGLYDRVTVLRAYVDGLINAAVWNKIYKSKLWKETRFPVGYVYEDIVTTYQIFNNSEKVYILDKVLYLRRIHSESITNTPSIINVSDHIWALSQIESFIEDNIHTLFNDNHLVRIHKKKLHLLIYLYILSFSKIGDKGNINHDDLKKQIIKLVKEASVTNLAMHYKIAYYLIYYCPCLIQINYLIYRKFRIIERKVFGAVQKNYR